MQNEFILSQTDGRPMYLQIIEQIKTRIAIGEWSQNYQLPSIRELAVSVCVSVITIKRAYQELEAAGVIVTLPGKGSFVAAKENLSAELIQAELDGHLVRALNTGKMLGQDAHQICQRIRQLERAVLTGEEKLMTNLQLKEE